MAVVVTELNNQVLYRQGSLAPAGYLNRIRGGVPELYYTAAGNSGAVTWTDGGAGGTFQVSGSNNVNAIYKPRNKTQFVSVRATDATAAFGVKALTVEATMPVQPQVGGEMEIDRETKVKRAKDRTPYFREEGANIIRWQFAWDAREKNQAEELREFWLDHRKVVPFWLVDTEGNLMNKVWFNSSYKTAFQGANRWAMAAMFEGEFTNLQAFDELPLTLKMNAGGFTIGEWIQDNFFTNGYSFRSGDQVIDTSGVVNPAPDEVYRWSRYDPNYVDYVFTGLRINALYNLRLHFCTDNNARTMQPVIQGVSQSNITPTLNFVATAYNYNNVLSDVAGHISLRLNRIAGVNAIINAIELTEVII
jgi:hypothetical protein